MIQNVYKPKGITSFQLVGAVKRQFNVKKAGHAGTLDPLAEGVMVVLTGSDTKKQDEFMHQNKEYLAEVTFGATTETLDLEQTPVFQKHITLEQVKTELPSILPKYQGDFEQKIPNYSAKKVNGKALYQLARDGTKDMSELNFYKPVRVEELKVMSYLENKLTTTTGELLMPAVELKIVCSPGFFVRTSAKDLGDALGCGAVLTKLVRTKVGNFSIENSIKVEVF